MAIKNHSVVSNNYELYDRQLWDVIIKHPNLSIVKRENKKVLKGVLDIPNDDERIVGNYLVEIHFTAGFPFRFPRLFEVGGSIPNDVDWHKFADMSCCITVLPDEIIKCKSGMTVLEFIEKYCFSFFANHIYRKLNNKYLNGEYSHGPKGLAEFYTSLLHTSETSLWLKYLDHVFRKATITTDRNARCFCGSNDKYKKCHKMVFDNMRDIGEKQILNDFKMIIS